MKLEGSLLSGASAPNNNWRLFEGQEIPADLYPGELSKEDVARGILTADRHESDPETANPSQICPQTKDGRWIMHSHIQQDLFDAWIDTIGFSWIREDERYKTAPAIPNHADRIALNHQIFDRFKEKTADEWREIYRANPTAPARRCRRRKKRCITSSSAPTGISSRLTTRGSGRWSRSAPSPR
jgi:hypothetical protein